MRCYIKLLKRVNKLEFTLAVMDLRLSLLDGAWFDTRFEQFKGANIECITLFERINIFERCVKRPRLNSCSIDKRYKMIILLLHQYNLVDQSIAIK